MIAGFKHRGLRRFYERGDGSKLNRNHLRKIRQIFAALDHAKKIGDMDLATFHLHELTGNRKGTWSVTVRSNWRITFTFVDGEAGDVNYEDYH